MDYCQKLFIFERFSRVGGVPRTDIIIESTSRNTRENAIKTTELLRTVNVNKILLVTSAFHMPRAAAAFRHEGLEVIPSPSEYLIAIDSNPSILDWLPSLGNMVKAQAVVHEMVGMKMYKLRGWID